MFYKLDKEQISELIRQPETGMGYQCVEATMNESLVNGIVFNSEVFIPEDKINKIAWDQFIAYSAILQEAKSSGNIRKLKVIKKESLHLSETECFSKAFQGPASEADISSAASNEVFNRFSPYSDDHRVKEDGSLLPGSYATTEEDARNVRTGTEAVLRYALPSDNPAIYIFTILPPQGTQIQRGIVKPANNKPGGGVEVIFKDGSPEKTVTGPKKIPAR